MRRVGLIIGGLSAVGASVASIFLARKTATAAKDAVEGVAPPAAPGATNTIKVHLTHYYPFESNLNAAQRKMEGNPVDATGAPLHTVEDFLAGKSDYVSLAGDLQGHKGTVWPYGQKILFPWGDKTLVGRVTDTGGHFHGINKVFRVLGAEPIDVCVFSSANHPPKSTVDVQVVVGDHFAKASAVAQLDKAGKAVVGCGFDLLGVDIIPIIPAVAPSEEDVAREKRARRADFIFRGV
jgi:hypothetical protein